jgi:hypothetical protein
MRGRTNTTTTKSSKASVSTSKRVGGKVRPSSNLTRTSSADTSIIVATHAQVSNPQRQIKLITEVDGMGQMNIEFVLILCYRYKYR